MPTQGASKFYLTLTIKINHYLPKDDNTKQEGASVTVPHAAIGLMGRQAEPCGLEEGVQTPPGSP